MAKRKVSASELMGLLDSGAEIEHLPSSLEVAIAGLREDLAVIAEARQAETATMIKALTEAVESVAQMKNSPDNLIEKLTEIMTKSQQRPDYEFTVKYNERGRLQGMRASADNVKH